MVLEGRTAIVYGGGGALGGAAARAFARAGAQVFLAGRSAPRLEAVARDIAAAGGSAHWDTVDALDAAAVEQHTARVAGRAPGIHIAFNAIGVVHVQGVPLEGLSLDDFALPVDTYIRSSFNIAKAVAPHMVRQRRGVVLSLTTPASRMVGPGFLGHSVACAGRGGVFKAPGPASSAPAMSAACAFARMPFRKRCRWVRTRGRCSPPKRGAWG
jgi:3-oxoacyl-[acyl-carrier protein] reductase